MLRVLIHCREVDVRLNGGLFAAPGGQRFDDGAGRGVFAGVTGTDEVVQAAARCCRVFALRVDPVALPGHGIKTAGYRPD